MLNRCTLLLGTASLLTLVACGSENTGPGAMGRVNLRLASAAAVAASPSVAAPATVSLGPDVLEISAVQLVARKLRLGPTSESCAAEIPDDADAEPTGETQGDCALLRLGPLLLDPPLTDASEASFEADIPAGTYRRIRLQIHKPTGSGAAAFLAENPELADVSVRVVGTFNGTDFVFTTALTVEEEIVLEEPLVVEEGVITPLTLVLDVQTWFVNQAGDALIDPAAATGGQLKSRIEQNIRTSFKARPE